MILLTMFLVGSAAAYGASRIAWPMLIVLIPTLVLFYVSAFFEWVNGRTGIATLLESSWIFLSGTQDLNVILEGGNYNCSFGMSLLQLGLNILPCLVLMVAALPGCAAFFGIPIGATMTVGGGLIFLVTREQNVFELGAKILAVALISIPIAGICLRVAVILAGVEVC